MCEGACAGGCGGECGGDCGGCESCRPKPREATISVEWMIPAGIKVNVETGKVEEVVVWSEQFNLGDPPFQIYAGGHHGYEAGELPEYLPKEHTLAKRALELTDRVDVKGLVYPRFTVRDEASG